MKKPRVRVKKFHRFLSVLLSAAMLLGMVEAAGLWASAAEEPVAEEVSPYAVFEDFEYEVLEDDTAEITDYTGDAAEVVIPSEIDGYEVTAIGDRAFFYRDFLESITIPDNVTYIGSAAFGLCPVLNEINLPSHEMIITADAFCDTAYSNNVENWEGDWLIIGNHKLFAFTYEVQNDGTAEITNYTGCAEKVVIPSEIDGHVVTSIGKYVFLNCDWIKNIEIPKSLKKIGGCAFAYCKSLLEINIPQNVTIIGYGAFSNCSSLKSIYIPKNVSEIGDLPFPGCISLHTVEVDEQNRYYSDVDGSLFNKEQTMMIYYPAGKAEKSYKIPEGVTKAVYGTFEKAVNLNSVTLPNSMTTIEWATFNSCNSLKEVTIPRSITSINYGFYECESIETIYGESGSYAEAFALEKGYEFIPIKNQIIPLPDSDIVLTETDNGTFISNLRPGSTVADLTAQLEESDLRITDKNGNPLEADDPIGTGCVVSCYAGEEVVSQATVVVFGDTTGDGRINVQDISRVQNHLLNLEQLDTISESAVRFGREQVDVSALLTVSAHVLQMKDIDQGLQIQ